MPLALYGRVTASAFERSAVRLLAAATSGVLLSLAQALEPVWWAAWVAPIPVLLAAMRAPSNEAWRLALVAGAIGVTTLVRYYLLVIGPLAGAVYLVLRAFSWAAIVMLTRAVVLRSHHWSIAFAYPLLMTGLVMLTGAAFGGAPYMALAYSQMDVLPVVQVASLFGFAGVDFVVNLFASLAAVTLQKGRRIARPWLAYGLPCAVVLAALAFGAARLGLADRARTLPIALAAMDRTPAEIRSPTDEHDPIWRAYGESVAAQAGAGARIVVLPEKLASIRASDAVAVRERLGRIAVAHGVYLVASLNVIEASHKENRGWMIAPDGKLVASYLKHHLVPGWESEFIAGDAYEVRSIAGGRFGIAICRDMDYPALSRRYAAEGIDGLIVPAADFTLDAWWHGRIAVLRGIESGFGVLRSAQFGNMTVSDRYGRVLGERRSSTGSVVSLAIAAPLQGSPTAYARTGDVLGWLCVAGALAILLLVAKSESEIE